MDSGRLETFSDGVVAIIITIMVLELEVPHAADPGALRPLVPVLSSYVLSFVYLGIYWNNHHHMFHAAERVNGRILWANLHLLFWLSLIPFATAWMGANGFAPWPVAAYGGVLLMAGLAYFILARQLAAHHGRDSKLARAFGRDAKGLASLVIYAAGIALSFFSTFVAIALYVAVALIWIVPDRRIERVFAERAQS